MTKQSKRFFIDVDFLTEPGAGNSTAGSMFLSNVPEDRSRVVSVLAEGEGCGVRAGVTASLTATMALRLAEKGIGLEQIAELILHSPETTFIEKLDSPSFSVLEARSGGTVEILEFGHPPVHLYRQGNDLPLGREPIALFDDLNKTVYRSRAACESGDRIMLFTESFADRFGGLDALNSTIKKLIRNDPTLSSRDLIHRAYETSFELTGSQPPGASRRCFTAASLFLRRPRKLLIATGAPYEKAKDPLLAKRTAAFDGKKAVCGGTTAAIISRELHRHLALDVKQAGESVPPTMVMEGIDLITEGTLTLGRVISILDYGAAADFRPRDAAEHLVALMLDSDIIEFLVGTRINETHQDPNLPAELDIRRNVVRRISRVLKERYVKEVTVEFM